MATTFPAPRPAGPGDAAGRSAALVAALRERAAAGRPGGCVQLLETHISYVLLAGEDAFKVKKPLRLPFLDFSSLAARRACCEEEVRLNRRTAPELYVGVVPIAGSPEAPVIGGPGEPIEYAVHMHRFPQEALLDALARRGRLAPAHAEALGEALARLHAGAARAGPDASWGASAEVLRDALDNFRDIEALGAHSGSAAELQALRAWTLRAHDALAEALARRRADGFVRECHGDLHLANVVLLGERPVPFDGIEFDPRLRWIDTMSDTAFAWMDLQRLGLPGLAARFLDAYLAASGDHGGVRVLRWYAVYRAMVRAKVACIRGRQAGAGAVEAARAAAEFGACLALAARLAHAAHPALVLMHGLSGSGKTVASGAIVEALGAVRVRSDVERKRLHGLAASAASGSAPGAGLYGERENDRTYERLAQAALAALDGGFCVVVDAAFLARRRRDAFRALASAAGAAFAIVACAAPEDERRARVARRQAEARDASEAGAEVLALQSRLVEPLGPDEVAHALRVDTSRAGAVDEAVAALARRLHERRQ